MSLENRSSSAMFKRAEQLKRWEESATNLEEIEPKLKSRKIQFSSGCVFLAACASGDKDEVLRLLDNGANIDTANVDGLTALHQACIDDNLDMVEFLVDHGADVNRGDNEGWTPLHATASCGFISIAKFLIENGANVAAVNNDGELPLDIAESDAMDEILQEMIDAKGVDCEEARNREENMMLSDARDWLSGKSEGFDPLTPHPKTGANALHVASAKGYIKVMSVLLQGHANVDSQDYDGWTPLHAAAHWGQKEAAEMLVEHFCDMDLKNCVGQTAVDVADPEMVKILESLRTKQAALHKDRPPPTDTQYKLHNSPNKRSSINRLSGTDKNNLISKDAAATISEEESTTNSTLKRVELEIDDELEKEDVSTTAEDSQLDLKSKGQDPECGRLNSQQSANAGSGGEEAVATAAPPWRRPGSFRGWNGNEVEQPPHPPPPPPTPPSRNLNLHIEKKESQPANKPQSPSSDVILRRTHSFEADEKFYRRYLELQARIASSCPTLHPPSGPGSLAPVPVKLPTRSASLREQRAARRNRTGATDDSRNSVDVTSTSVKSTTATTAATTTTTTTSRTVSSPTSNSQPAIRSISNSTVVPGTPTIIPPTPPVTPSTPTTPGGGGKLSPGNIFKNFFKSFVPPVRDEESETQRKAHAKRVRETRRSTQGVTLEEIKTAEQLVKKKNQQINNNNNNTIVTDMNQTNNSVTAATTASITTTTVTTPTQSGEDNNNHERRPSWRLKVDTGSKFLLEDARDKQNPASGDASTCRRPPPPQAVDASNDTSVTIPLRKVNSPGDDKDKEDTRNVLATQAVIQRRRKPKRRSTGVVHVDMEEIDPERQEPSGPGGDSDSTLITNNDESGDRSARSSSRLSSLSSTAGDVELAANENGEVDYKKLYEESLVVNDRLRDRLKKTEEELDGVRSNNSKSSSMSELEKRERRAMERKLAEMEEELKLLDALKQENQRLKDENGALIRVISKLSK